MKIRIEFRSTFRPDETLVPEVQRVQNICKHLILGEIYGIMVYKHAALFLGDDSYRVRLLYISNNDGHWDSGWCYCGTAWLKEKKLLLRSLEQWLKENCTYKKGEWWYK